MSKKILLVEDDAKLLQTVQGWLEIDGYVVEAVSDGNRAVELLAIKNYDLIIVDWMLPGLTGLEICKHYRNAGGTTPLLFLTGRDTLMDKEEGFVAGGDDYLTKPFQIRELTLRVQALLRRSQNTVLDIMRAGGLVLNSRDLRVTYEGKEIHLARMEFALLEFFMRSPGQLFTQDQILESVWTDESERSPEALRTCLKKLRRKIDGDRPNSFISNVHGIGYRFEAAN